MAILVKKAMGEDRVRQLTFKATPRGGDPTTPAARTAGAGPAAAAAQVRGREGTEGEEWEEVGKKGMKKESGRVGRG